MQDRPLTIRPAEREDVQPLLALLVDDFLGSTRENVSQASLDRYHRFFDIIEDDPNNVVYVVEEAGEMVGTFQLTYIPSLTFGGTWRSQVEAVRVTSERRGQGLGTRIFEWITDQAREKNCVMVQLTTNQQRDKAQHFYERLGFVKSHVGYKLMLK